MKRILMLIIAIFCLTVAGYAADNANIDNMNVQEYKGKLGLWVSVSSGEDLNRMIKDYGIGVKDIKEVNNNSLAFNDYIFIPFSEAYIKELESKGFKRQKISSAQNEFIWPMNEINSISSSFGMRNHKMHTGIDLPSPKGTPIVAVMDGRVISTNYDGGHGKTIYIEHRNGFYSRYSHNSVNLVKRGDFVKKGQIIGFVGSTGTSTGNHLHFEIRYKDIPLNPVDFLPVKEQFKAIHQMRNFR